MNDYLNGAYKDILLETDPPLLWITRNRPQCSNAFSDEMISDLCHVLREADWDDDVRVIILTGAGKTFCAGGDVKAMEEKTGMFAGDPEGLREETEKLARCIAANSPVAVSMIKKAIRLARTAEISGHLDLLAAFQGITQRTEDHFKRVRALKKKR
jgi:enoyl-CoA hydratase/carnithine racemase